VLHTRTLRITGAPSNFFKDGEPIEGRPDLDALRQATWMRRLIHHAMDAVYWGHSLIEVYEDTNHEGLGVRLIPRSVVFPEFRQLTIDSANPPPTWDAKPMPGYFTYDDLPQILIEADPNGDGRYMGLLNEAARSALYNKAVIASWAEFTHIFGMPLRLGKMPMGASEARKDQVNDALRDMGSAAYILLEGDEDVQFAEGTYSDAFKVFDSLLTRNDAYLSKLVLGQTMTTEDGSSRSQAEVHMQIFDQITQSDADYIESIINGQLLPRLAAQGLVKGIDGLEFRFTLFEREEPKAEQFKREIELVKAGYNIPAQHFADKYGITGISDKAEQQPLLEPTNDNNPAPNADAIKAMVDQLYSAACNHGGPQG
jgi:phage gp29-like protein